MAAWLRSLFGKRDEPQFVDIEIMWGGYYASQDTEKGDFDVFRLIDFNRDAYHSTLFREHFATRPSLAEVRALSPAILHVPIDARGLLRRAPQLIGSVPLSAADLEGYMLYLEHHHVPAEQRAALETKLIGFSHEAPLPLRLSEANGELQIAERQ